MNLLKKTIGALLIAGFVFSCSEEEDFIKITESVSNGPGVSALVLSSFTATAGEDADGLNDGTYITVQPLSVGVSSYTVDFGDTNSTADVLTITEQNGTVSYDYPNNDRSTKYTITVTAKATGLEDVVKTEEVTVIHGVVGVSTAPTATAILDADGYAIFSDGNYTNKPASSDFEDGDAEYNLVAVGDPSNNVIQYSRLQEGVVASIDFGSVIAIADVFGTGASADYLNLDLHSIHNKGIDIVKITLGGKTIEKSLANDTWTNLIIDFAAEGITQIDNITLELGTGGTASNESTLNVDNIIIYRTSLSAPDFTFDDVASDFDVTFTDASTDATSYSWNFGDGNSSTDASPTHTYANNGIEEVYTVTLTTTNSLNKTSSISKDVTVGGPAGAIDPEIVHGDFNLNDSSMSAAWKIANTTGKSDPFGRSSDGSCTDYDGTMGSKTRGAKWSASQSANADGSAVAGNTRYAYQAVTLSPNTDYIFEYEYAIKTGGAATNSIVAAILNGHFSDSAVAVASNALVENVGTEANGKFGDNNCAASGKPTKLRFRSNAVGEVSILIYAVTDQDAFVDNVKIYPAL